MKTESASVSRFRFGAFELDLRTGELIRGRNVIILPPLPLRILTLLVNHPGELVTRNEIQEQIWGNDTFVDFENGLNYAINKIRAVLGDNADSPRYIETLPRRGYRFIAPVNGHVDQAATETCEPPAQAAEAPVAGRRPVWKLAIPTTIIVMVAAVGYLLRPTIPPPKVLRTVQITSDGRQKADRMATDGLRIYFSEIVDGHWTPVVAPAAGGESVPISTPFRDAFVLDISSSGSELLVESLESQRKDNVLWALPTVGGVPRRLGNLPISSQDAAWSPDGSAIVYVKDNGDLYVVNSDGTASRKLLSPPGAPYLPRWSPDGNRINFSLANFKSNTLWEVSADGTNPHPILPAWDFSGAACSGYWTHDGKYLLFDSYRGGLDSVWATREKVGFFENVNSEPVQLTSGASNSGRPVPSKDGMRIFLSRQSQMELVRYDARSKQFVPFLPGISARMVDFSKDGKWVAYVSFPGGNLFRSKVDGSQRIQLNPSQTVASVPNWSPDGRQIAFSAHAPNEHWKMYLISADGGTIEELKSSEWSGSGPDGPQWSPDGNVLAFGATPGKGRDSAILLLDLRTRIVATLPGSEGHYSPRWSPDGRYIATQKVDEPYLMLFDLKTREWKELPRVGVGNQTWSRDGKYLYFSIGVRQDPGCWRVRINDLRLDRVFSFKDLRSPDWWISLAPDDSPLIMTDLGVQEIFAIDWEAP